VDKRRRGFIIGTILICLPVLILTFGAISVYSQFINVRTTIAEKGVLDSAPGGGGIGITISHPPKGFFDSTAQILIAVGVCFTSFCSGIAVVIKAIRT
jgi:hypothetical protein